MQGSVGYCKVLRSTAGYTRGVLGGNYLGTVEYCKYWAELGEGTVLVVPRSTLKYPSVPRSTLQYPEVPCSTLQYPAVSSSTPQYPSVPPRTYKYFPVLGVLGGTRGTGGTGCTACYPPVPFSTCNNLQNFPVPVFPPSPPAFPPPLVNPVPSSTQLCPSISYYPCPSTTH